jgi:hypothetical protein
MEYREFLSLTDYEIKQIVNDIFNPVKIENINRNSEYNEITCDITTGGWDDGESSDFEVTDTLELKMPTVNNCGLSIDFSLNKDDIRKWKQFLLAKGCNELLRDNPYLIKTQSK